MCGRYALAQAHEALRVRFGFVDDPVAPYQIFPRYNVAPTQMAAIVTNGEGRKLKAMQWGLIPHWAREASIGANLINARSDTVAEKPSFRDSFRRRRCLVPATGFFEWKKDPLGKSKQPMYITVKDQELFSFAGLWSVWEDPQKKLELLTFTILTTEPNEFMKTIHNRMPVILRPELEAVWLDHGSPPVRLKEALAPYPADQMVAVPVSKLVNSPRNDTPDCISPL